MNKRERHCILDVFQTCVFIFVRYGGNYNGKHRKRKGYIYEGYAH